MATRVSPAVAASIVAGGSESVNFLNEIVAQLWEYITVIGAQLTREIVEPMFEQQLPASLSSLKFSKIDLGKRPVTLDNITVHQRSKGLVKFDVDVIWDGNCDVRIAGKIISFGVRHVKVSGRMSVVMCPLLDQLPLIGAFQIAFINPPKLFLNFTGLAEIAELPMIESSIYGIIDNVLANMVVLPARLLIKIDHSTDWFDVFQPDLGFLRLTVNKGYGFIIPKELIRDIPDVYCMVRVGAAKEWRTKTIMNDTSPVWNQTSDFLLSDVNQSIIINAYDNDFVFTDDYLGRARISVGELLRSNKRADLPLIRDNKDTKSKVQISCELLEFVKDLSSFVTPQHKGEGLMCGMLTILVKGIRHLPVRREEASSSVKVNAFGKECFTVVAIDTPGNIDGLNPNFDLAFRVPLTQKMIHKPTVIRLTLMNKRVNLGQVNIPFEAVKTAPNYTLTKDFSVGSGAKILAQMVLRGVQVVHS